MIKLALISFYAAEKKFSIFNHVRRADVDSMYLHDTHFTPTILPHVDFAYLPISRYLKVRMRTSRPYQRPGKSAPKAGSFPQRDPLRRRYIGNVGLNGVVHEADISKKIRATTMGLCLLGITTAHTAASGEPKAVQRGTSE